MIDFNLINNPYFIGEIGINHNGDIQIAKKLLDAVHACEWDCGKFQKRNPDISVPKKQMLALKTPKILPAALVQLTPAPGFSKKTKKMQNDET